VPAGTERVELAVYGVTGALVATLPSVEAGPERRVAVWRGLDDRGNQVASGTYFLRLSADGEVTTRKMVLLK